MENPILTCLYSAPDIMVYMNCDTCFALNLSSFNLTEYDELIFTIKNASHRDSRGVFSLRVQKCDMDEKGEVLFKITPDIAKQLKYGAFYNIAILADFYDITKKTEYRKLTDNGKILLDYGAYDLSQEGPKEELFVDNIVGVRLEPVKTE